MRIIVKGKNENITNKELVYAARFFADMIMTKRLSSTLDVEIVFRKKMDFQGYMECIDSEARPKDFSVSLRKNLTKKKALLTLAHEMVHVKQYARGELKYLWRAGHDKWNGKIVSRDTHYFDKPWEIEAFGRELGLYERYIEHKRENKIKF